LPADPAAVPIATVAAPAAVTAAVEFTAPPNTTRRGNRVTVGRRAACATVDSEVVKPHARLHTVDLAGEPRHAKQLDAHCPVAGQLRLLGAADEQIGPTVLVPTLFVSSQ